MLKVERSGNKKDIIGKIIAIHVFAQLVLEFGTLPFEMKLSTVK
jgi:hypothetical protein